MKRFIVFSVLAIVVSALMAQSRVLVGYTNDANNIVPSKLKKTTTDDYTIAVYATRSAGNRYTGNNVEIVEDFENSLGRIDNLTKYINRTTGIIWEMSNVNQSDATFGTNIGKMLRLKCDQINTTIKTCYIPDLVRVSFQACKRSYNLSLSAYCRTINNNNIELLQEDYVASINEVKDYSFDLKGTYVARLELTVINSVSANTQNMDFDNFIFTIKERSGWIYSNYSTNIDYEIPQTAVITIGEQRSVHSHLPYNFILPDVTEYDESANRWRAVFDTPLYDAHGNELNEDDLIYESGDPFIITQDVTFVPVSVKENACDHCVVVYPK